MPLITLTTDYGLKDHFAAALKGKLFKAYDQVRIVDLTHEIQPFNLVEAAYVLEAAHLDFPAGTVHLIGINSEASEKHPLLILRWNDQYFVSADNGIPSILSHKQKPQALYRITLDLPNKRSDMDIMAQVAAHLAKGGDPLQVSEFHTQVRNLHSLRSNTHADQTEISGNIIHIDAMGNAISTISKADFDRIANGRAYEVILNPVATHNASKYSGNLRRIHLNYKALNQSIESSGPDSMSQEGNIFALFNEAGYLEIGIFRGIPNANGSAKDLLGIQYQDPIKIVFNS